SWRSCGVSGQRFAVMPSSSEGLSWFSSAQRTSLSVAGPELEGGLFLAAVPFSIWPPESPTDPIPSRQFRLLPLPDPCHARCRRWALNPSSDKETPPSPQTSPPAKELPSPAVVL